MTTPSKLDLFKSLKSEYASPKNPTLLTTTPGVYLSASGDGPPGGETFSDRIADLYAVAYTLKFRRKLGAGPDFAVGKTECIWHALPETRDSADGWSWQLLIRVPDVINDDDLEGTIAALIEKKKPVSVRNVKRVTLHEDRCVQMLHLGPYENEPETFALMQAFACESGFKPAGPPHEIYLSDPRRVEPANLKTILRLPVSAA